MTTLIPVSDWLSVCSTPFTVDTSTRSKLPTTRVSISSGEIPVYVQMTATTGISISGKISVGIRWMVTVPMMAMSSAITTNV